jgi:hypothetical protein
MYLNAGMLSPPKAAKTLINHNQKGQPNTCFGNTRPPKKIIISGQRSPIYELMVLSNIVPIAISVCCLVMGSIMAHPALRLPWLHYKT